MIDWQTIKGKLDIEKQLPAVDEKGTTVVAAGAGSGKTTVLSIRYLNLLKERKLSPEEILCMTFTTKAAAEMNERILSMLEDCAKTDADFKEALQLFSKSRISTLDSFCSEVAKTGSYKFGISPDFTIDESKLSSLIEKRTKEILLMHRKEPAIANFILYSSKSKPNGFQKAKNTLIDFAIKFPIVTKEDFFNYEKQTDTLFNYIFEQAQKLYDCICPAFFSSEKESDSIEYFRSVLAELEYLTEAKEENLSKLVKVCSKAYHLRKISSSSKSETGQILSDNGEAIKKYARNCMLAYSQYSSKHRKDFLEFIKNYIDEINKVKADSGILSYADISAIAELTLKDNLELRDWYKNKYKAIMIDEFQDNNETQKNILFCLSEKRSIHGDYSNRTNEIPSPKDLEPGILFFVGDEKQSIYAFRGADVSVFRNLSKDLGSSGNFVEHNLNKNWRSEPNIIDFFNKTFSCVLANDNDAKDFEARFSSLEAGSKTEGAESKVVFYESTDSEDKSMLSGKENELLKIAELIKELVTQENIIAVKAEHGKEARQCRYEDIAILLRSTTLQSTIEKNLRLFNIPYSSQVTLSLFTESVFADIYNILRLVVYPNDRQAFACVLRGPFGRLKDSTVVFCIENSITNNILFSLDPSCIIDLQEQEKYQKVKSIWQSIYEKADIISTHKIVEYIWYECGLRWNVLKDKNITPYLEHYDYCWNLALDSDNNNERLVDFVTKLESLIGDTEKFDKKILKEKSKGVQIMTIHASKGLEFPVVFVPNMEKIGKSDEAESLYCSKKFGFSGPELFVDENKSEFINAIYSIEDTNTSSKETLRALKQVAETARLFYVACTRAISRLYLSSTLPTQKDNAKRSFRSLFNNAWETISKERPQDIPTYLSFKTIEQKSITYKLNINTEKDTSQNSRIESVLNAESHEIVIRKNTGSVTGLVKNHLQFKEQEKEEILQIQQKSNELQANEFGTICHTILEFKIKDAVNNTNCYKEKIFEDKAISAIFSRFNTEKINKILDKAESITSSFIESDLYKEAILVSKTGFIETEYNFVYKYHEEQEDGKTLPFYLNGTMDLVFGNNNKTTIIDYKTDKEENPEEHKFQLTIYKTSAEAIFKLPAKAYIFYLRTGNYYEV